MKCKKEYQERLPTKRVLKDCKEREGMGDKEGEGKNETKRREEEKEQSGPTNTFNREVNNLV